MKAQISAIHRDYVDIGTPHHEQSLPTTYQVELVVTDCTESLEQLSDWFKDETTFTLVADNPQ